MAVMTASVNEMTNGTISLLFGANQIDSISGNLGQDPLGSYPSTSTSASVILNNGKTANLSFITNGASGLESDGKTVVSVTVLSDWKATNPQGHRGVVYNDAQFYFRVEGFVRNDDGNIDWSQPIPTRFYSRSSTSPNAQVRLDMPLEKSIRFVFVAQVRSVGCSGNDSLKVTSEVGLIQILNDGLRYNMEADETPYPIQDVAVRCVVYSSGAVSSKFMAPSSNKQPGLNKPVSSIERIGSRYFMRLK